MLKPVTMMLFALTSPAIFAGTMGPICSSVNITTPCEKNNWMLQGHAIYVQPNAAIFGLPYDLSSGTQTISYGLNPSWGWGYELKAGYLFDHGNDIYLNWYHYRNSNSQTITTPDSLTYSYSGGTEITIDIAESYYSNQPEWDQVNVEFGERSVYSEHRVTRFHAGVAFSHLKNSTNENFTQATTITPPGTAGTYYPINIYTTSTFNGFGPRLGMDLKYSWTNGLSVYAKGAASLLAGASKSNSLGAEVINFHTSYNRAIGALDSKLGVGYDKVFNNHNFYIDFGWLWASYFNALSRKDNDLQSQFATSANFEIQGLFFGLKWTGNPI